MTALLREPQVIKVVSDLCQFGLVTCVDGVFMPAKKTTGFATNSPDIAAEISKRCMGHHVHGQLLGGRAKFAQEYTPALCHAICLGLRKHLARERLEDPGNSVMCEVLNLEAFSENAR